VEDLLNMGIIADVILFHPYDRWGFAKMDAAHDEAYLRYVISRLSAYRNIWWTMANEYDLMKPPKDWDRIFQIVQERDPYDHPRSNHNCRGWYDHSKPWVTHCNIQNHDVYKTTMEARETYKKPVVIDEYGYEGNIPQGWGNKSALEEIHRHWSLTLAGGYGSHGETYQHPDDLLWWAIGGKLRGHSPLRLGFLKKIMTQAPYEDMWPRPDLVSDGYCLAKAGEYYLFYLIEKKPTVLKLRGNSDFQLEIIDTWNMRVNVMGSVKPEDYTFTPPHVPCVVRAIPEEK
jgi:hypothetical protein